MGTPLVAVYGTHGGDFAITPEPCTDPSHWWHYRETDDHDSAWWAYMRGIGFVPLRTDHSFVWSGDLNGLGGINPLQWFNKGRRVTDWQAGGRALLYYAGPLVYDTLTGAVRQPWACIAHSHGGQVALFAAMFGLRIPLLITIATPHRSDLTAVAKEARKYIGHWIHVSDRTFDEIGLAGQLGDGSIDISRHQPLADVNVSLDDISHSRLLCDPDYFHQWAESILPRDIATSERHSNAEM